MPGTTLDISEARKQLNSLDERLTRERPVIYITRHNKKAFVAVNLEYFSALMETVEVLSDRSTMDMLHDSIQDIRNGRLIDHDEVRELIGDEGDE